MRFGRFSSGRATRSSSSLAISLAQAKESAWSRSRLLAARLDRKNGSCSSGSSSGREKKLGRQPSLTAMR